MPIQVLLKLDICYSGLIYMGDLAFSVENPGGGMNGWRAGRLAGGTRKRKGREGKL